MIVSSFNSGAGKIEININSTHESVAEIVNLGSLNYSFDQTPDTLSIDRVQALYTYINVDLLQYDDGGNDLWTILTQETNQEQLFVEMAVELPGGAFQFFFKLRKSDLSVNEKQGVITIRLTPLTNFNTRMGQFFDSLYAKSVDNRVFTAKSIDDSGSLTNFNYNSVSAKNFIENALNEVFENSFESVSISSATDLGNGFSESVLDEFTNSKRQFVLCDIRTRGGISGTSKVSPSTPEDSIEVGIGQIGSLGLPSLTVNITIPAENNAGLGDVIYYGDDAPFFNGRKIGTIVDFSTGIFPTFTIQKDEDDNVPLPFGSFPFKIQRAKRPENTLLIDVLKDLAGIEGSVFGTGFSRNWYVNRLRVEEQGSENLVTLNYNELQEFKPFNLTLSLGRSVVGQLAEYRSIGTDLFGQWNQKLPILTDENENPQTGSGVPNLSSFNSITSGNKEATKGIDISLAPAYPFLNKGLTTSSTVIGTQDSTINDASLESALTRNGLKSYFQALNSTKDSIAVEFTILDAVKVLPFQLFQFDSRAPERYRDKQFRITQVSYNFVNNTCKIKGYQISSITTPVVDDPRPVVPPPRVAPPFRGDPIGRLITGINDEDVTSVFVNLFESLDSGRPLVILNKRERDEGFFQDNQSGIYEVSIDKGSVADLTDIDLVGVMVVPREKGATTTTINIRATVSKTLTQGTKITLVNNASNTQEFTIADTVTTIASDPFPGGGVNTIITVEQAVLQHRFPAGSSVALDGYTVKEELRSFPTGENDIPIQLQRINAPAGSDVFGSAPYEEEGDRVTQQSVTQLNVSLTNISGEVNATASALSVLNVTVSNIDGVVTAQAFAITQINSEITNIDGQIDAQASAISSLNTRVTSAEGSITSQASAITAIQSDITNIDGQIDAQASAISSLQTCVSSIDGTVTAQGSSITSINATIDGLDDDIKATAFALDETNVFVEAIDGKVSNISAKRAIVVGAGNKLAQISLSANDGDGSTGSSEINISADQVKINDIVFEDANGIIRSDPFTAGTTGWRIRGGGDAEFENIIARGKIGGEIDVETKVTSAIYIPNKTSPRVILGSPDTWNNGLWIKESTSTIVPTDALTIGGSGGPIRAQIFTNGNNLHVRVPVTNGRIIIETGGNGMGITGLPTSNPGGTNNIWKDSNGFLRIT